jgi:hypothetical protein
MLDELIHLFSQALGRRRFRDGGRGRELRRFSRKRRGGYWNLGWRPTEAPGGPDHPADGSRRKADQPGDKAAMTPALSCFGWE